MQKTIEEIVNETLAYYEEDPRRRAVTLEGCEYLTEDGRMCAVGRCLHGDADARTLKNYASCIYRSNAGLPSRSHYRDPLILDDLLKEEYRGHPVAFWDSLQRLHDDTNGDHLWDLLHVAPSEETRVKRRAFADRIIEEYSTPIN